MMDKYKIEKLYTKLRKYDVVDLHCFLLTHYSTDSSFTAS